MRIGIVGLGLGYSLAKYIASFQHEVIGVDIDEGSFKNPRVDDEMRRWIESNDFPVKFTTNFRALEDAQIIMIFVSTPLEEGRISTRNVLTALLSSIHVNLTAEYVILSTLPMGTMKTINAHFPEISVCYAPPMVKKHRFLSTFRDPPSGWQLFGGPASFELITLYRSLQLAYHIVTSPEIAEAAKLCTNLMLAMKIVMANSIAEWVGEDGSRVCEIVGRDPRIGEGYFKPGGPASGPCLPRDLTELSVVASGDLKEIVSLLNKVNRTEELI